MILRPEDTEFHTVFDSYPYSLLSFFGSGSEALTYQFVVKAIPYSVNKDYTELQKEWGKATLEEMRDRVAEKEKRILELEAKEKHLEAILKSWSWRITAPLRWLHQRRLRKKSTVGSTSATL